MIHPQRALGVALAILLGLLAAAPLSSQTTSGGIRLTTAEKLQLQREARLVVDLLQNHHYSGRTFREIENKEMVTRYLGELDPRADFLTTDDIEFIHRRFDRTLKSVYLFRGDLQPAFEIFDLFAERARERLAWVAQRLTRYVDLDSDETHHFPRKPEAAASGTQADQRWELRLKDEVLAEIMAGRTPGAAREAVGKRFAKTARRIATADSFAIREHFFDAVIRSFDPHSGYFSADSSREFAVDMENAVIGLGLDLRKEAGRCVVSAVQPGGPADLHSTIAAGDTLVALAEGDGQWIDLSTKRLREIVGLIRGEAGGKLRVAFQPEGTTQRLEVPLERTRVVLAADRARGAISAVPGPDGRARRIGWITLPSFYAGGEGANATSAARDMGELLDQMAAQGIEGLVIDLRTNPGGALTEAVAISQLFLPGGTVLLSRGPDGKTKEHPLKQQAPAYAGPLVVLTSAQSASASEIFAGAMKFHRRAVVVGGAATFGKGTSQAYIPLAKLTGVDAANAKDWGTLRLTAERFFLPDGRAVQRAGVTSHIVLPDFDPPAWQREAELPQALPGESIPPPPAPAHATVGPPPLPDDLLQHLSAQAARNFQDRPEWELWRQEQQFYRTQSEQEARSLRLPTREKEWAEALAKIQVMQRTRRALTTAEAYGTQPLEIAAVQSAFAAHETKLRALDQSTGKPLLHRLGRSGFFVETDHGHLREVRLAAISGTAYLGDTEALATAFSGAAGHPVTADDARRILQELSLLEEKTDTALLAVVAAVTGGALAETEARSGTEALLLQLSELDGELRRERAGLDVPLREGLRLAAAWAERRAEPAAP